MKDANDAKPTAAQRAETYKESEQQFENVPESVAARTEGVMDVNPAFAGDPNSAPENGDALAGDEDDDPDPAPVPEPPAAPEPPVAPAPAAPKGEEVFAESEAEVIEARAGAPADEGPAEPAPFAPAPTAPTAGTDPAVQRELDDLGRHRAHKVYDWLGFIGGVFALALGITLLTVGLPPANVEFGADFYTLAYTGIAQIGLILKVGLFGVLVSMGLGLMGTFGPRLLKDDRPGRRHHRH